MITDVLNIEQLICNTFILAIKNLNIYELNNVDFLKYLELIKDYYYKHLGQIVTIDQITIDFFKTPIYYQVNEKFDIEWKMEVSDFLKPLFESVNAEFVEYLKEKYITDKIIDVDFSYRLKSDDKNTRGNHENN